MQVLDQKESLTQLITSLKAQNKSIGFVPTMGTLHEGHFSLIQKSKNENDITVCSIYVNPTQFNNPSDLEKYPRKLEEDLTALKGLGCDIVFTPTNDVMYPYGANNKHQLTFNFGEIERQMEGKFRAGHFNGVGIVVSKLFHMVQPHKAYFGLKDLQQYLIIKKMVKELSFEIDVRGCPTVREEDGLAMSSRNLRLKSEERAIAPAVYQTLRKVQVEIEENGNVNNAILLGKELLMKHPEFDLEYLETAHVDTLLPLEKYEKGQSYCICIAAHLGGVRLIDNILVE